MTPADPVRDGIPCLLMRGGTSKGAYFLAADLPADDGERDDLLLRIMGTPDGRQIDGIGGAHPLTSKVAVIAPSGDPDADVDYLFLQIGTSEAVVSTAQTCGNLLAGVGPFAIERGLVRADQPLTRVRIRLVNTGALAVATVPTPAGGVEYAGTTAIDGVPGVAAAIEIEMIHPRGGGLLPTGNVVDEIDGHPATLVDNGMPVVLLRADEFGVTGAETAAQLEERTELRDAVERVRLAAGAMLGIDDVAHASIPKVFLLSAPRAGGAICTRAFIPARVHTSIGVVMASSVAAGVRIPGAVGADLAELPEGDAVPIEHPSGIFSAVTRIAQDGGTWRSTYSASVRTARKLFDGRVYARPPDRSPAVREDIP
jgi:4-oxalomesaconate tautomerase